MKILLGPFMAVLAASAVTYVTIETSSNVLQASDKPWLEIKKMDLGTNIQSSLAWSSSIVYCYNDLLDNYKHVYYDENDHPSNIVTVVCGKTICVELSGPAGTTNEIERSRDLNTWVPSNVRLISDGTPFRCWVNTDSNQMIFFRACRR